MVATTGCIGKKLIKNRIQAARSLYTNTFQKVKTIRKEIK